jgi:predicted GNAT family acetyltransferase
MDGRFSDNRAQSRFELDISGQVAFANYRRPDEGLAIYHVETPRSLRGQGVAGKLMEAIVSAAQAEGSDVIPFCSYASAWMRRRRAGSA